MAELYKKITVPSGKNKQPSTTNRAYKGISTVNPDNNSKSLFDISLIKQDIINHFNIRQGEKISNPQFGCIIWDALYEPLTQELKDAITRNVTTIVNFDPRVRAESVSVSEYESGLQIECVLTYLTYNISENLRIQFDKENGIL